MFHCQEGFALPAAMALAMIMLTLMVAAMLSAQDSRDSSQLRKSVGASRIIADSAIARALVELSRPENSLLLVRNYDPLNPRTNQTYLGIDGNPNTGDETGAAMDQWTNFSPSPLSCFQTKGQGDPNIQLSGTIGPSGHYRILAYRYNPNLQIGNVLVQGEQDGLAFQLLVSISVYPDLENFPGIILNRPDPNYNAGVIGLRGRDVIGSKSNVYFVPTSSADASITGAAQPGDANRSDFLNAIWSSESDGAISDSVGGALIACDAQLNIPNGTPGENLGIINSTQTIYGANGPFITPYRVEQIDLAGTEVLTIDTTGGPVQIELIYPGVDYQPLVTLRDQSKIINVRTDGQPPRVGDVRIMNRTWSNPVVLYDQACIHLAFYYAPGDELRLFTDSPGCPGGQNTNFEGVVWVEALLSSKNDVSNRNINYLDPDHNEYDTLVTPGATSGIAVPDDVSSVADLLPYTQIPIHYRFGEIKRWQQVSI